jgi:hypothetical protein
MSRCSPHRTAAPHDLYFDLGRPARTPIGRGMVGRGVGCIALFLILSACASTSNEPVESDVRADRRSEAVNVVPTNPKADILALLRTYLNNPTGIRDAAISQPALKQVGIVRRYVVCVRFNARNSDGKYTGVKDRPAIFVGGRLDQISEVARDLCADAEYKPFPEAEALTR